MAGSVSAPTFVHVDIRSGARADMDRFSTRLAASLIEDRHREAAAARRRTNLPPTGSDVSAGAGQTSGSAFERALGALRRPLRFRAPAEGLPSRRLHSDQNKA